MPLSGAERAKKYRERRRSLDEDDFLMKDKERKRKERIALKMDDDKYSKEKEKDRRRKRMKKMENLNDSCERIGEDMGTFKSRQSLGKSVKKVSKALPNSPRKKATVIRKIVRDLDTESKKQIFTESRRQYSDTNVGRPEKFDDKKREEIIASLERLDISYTCPGRKEQVYCGKKDGEKLYKEKHYLL